MENTPNFNSNRSDLLYDLSCNILSFAFDTYFNYSQETSESLKSLNKEPLVVLPFPHTKYIDIPLEAHAIKSSLNRSAYFIMTETLPLQSFLRRLGGIPIARPKDMNQNGFIGKSRASQIRGLYERTIPSLLDKKEIVVIHPEADINSPRFHQGVLNGLMRSQNIHGRFIYFVPLQIKNISGSYGLGSRYHLSLNSPFIAENSSELRKHLESIV